MQLAMGVDKDGRGSAAGEPFSSDPPQVLSIAGSDPSGGAGIQADLKTFASFGCYGMAVVTALTAQNTRGVTDVHIPPSQFFRAQLKAIFADVRVDAIKVGMMGNQEIVRALSEELQAQNVQRVPIVLDPVMVSTSGSLLLTHDSVQDLIALLLPLCTLLTPNIPEAEQLLKHAGQQNSSSAGEIDKIDDIEMMLTAAHRLAELGPPSVLIKGGHQACSPSALNSILASMALSAIASREKNLASEVSAGTWRGHSITVIRSDAAPYAEVLGSKEATKVVTDVLYECAPDRFTLFVKPCIDSTATHGTGCTLSSACAAALASSSVAADHDRRMVLAVHHSIEYVQGAIGRGLERFGAGNGPLNHITNLVPRPILAPTERERAPFCARMIAHSLPDWRAYTQHPFIRQMASYTLSRDSFVYFLRQDYLFLKHYARVWASGASSFTIGNTFDRIGSFAGIAAEMAKEAENHIEICKPWGITRRELENETAESAATLAYTRFVLDVSRAGDVRELLAATGPCLLGYGEAARWIAGQQRRSPPGEEGERQIRQGLKQWIDFYNGVEFQRVVTDGITNMERYADEDPPSVARMKSLQRIWDAAVRLEIGMWDEALDVSKQRMVFGP